MLFSALTSTLPQYPLYGPLADADENTLDSCNGRVESGKYVYHARTKGQVDAGPYLKDNAAGAGKSYCAGTSPAINWRYMVGCYKGDTKSTVVADCSTKTLPADCKLVKSNNLELLWKDGKCLIKGSPPKGPVFATVGVLLIACAVIGCWKKRLLCFKKTEVVKAGGDEAGGL